VYTDGTRRGFYSTQSRHAAADHRRRPSSEGTRVMFRTFNLVFHAMLVVSLVRDRRIPFYKKAIPLLGLAYVFSPIDFIPDWVLGPGQLDDVAVMFMAFKLFERSVPAHILEEHQEKVRLQLEKLMSQRVNRTDEPPTLVEVKQYTIRFPEERGA
jgi:uncharacterized membrane protein YkvA (DUF1232 family)